MSELDRRQFLIEGTTAFIAGYNAINYWRKLGNPETKENIRRRTHLIEVNLNTDVYNPFQIIYTDIAKILDSEEDRIKGFFVPWNDDKPAYISSARGQGKGPVSVALLHDSGLQEPIYKDYKRPSLFPHPFIGQPITDTEMIPVIDPYEIPVSTRGYIEIVQNIPGKPPYFNDDVYLTAGSEVHLLPSGIQIVNGLIRRKDEQNRTLSIGNLPVTERLDTTLSIGPNPDSPFGDIRAIMVQSYQDGIIQPL